MMSDQLLDMQHAVQASEWAYNQLQLGDFRGMFIFLNRLNELKEKACEDFQVTPEMFDKSFTIKKDFQYPNNLNLHMCVGIDNAYSRTHLFRNSILSGCLNPITPELKIYQKMARAYMDPNIKLDTRCLKAKEDAIEFSETFGYLVVPSLIYDFTKGWITEDELEVMLTYTYAETFYPSFNTIEMNTTSNPKTNIQMGDTKPLPTLSKGEKMVRTEFNPSQDSWVDQIKQKSAELINLCETIKEAGHDPRLTSLAQTAFEEAAMWGVKAATSQPAQGAY